MSIGSGDTAKALLIGAFFACVCTPAGRVQAQAVESQAPAPLIGQAALGDWRADNPGLRRLITPGDLPAPYATRSASNSPRVVDRPADAVPKAPPGFRVRLFASGLDEPRTIRIAPNGDVFVAESAAGRIRILRAPDDATKPAQSAVFAVGLNLPFGIAFYPPGPDPRYLYVATTDAVVRFPYHNGDLEARGLAESVVPDLPTGGHWTRDVVFSQDGTRMFVSVGSDSNVAQGMRKHGPYAIHRIETTHGPGAAWDDEERRADVLVFDPNGNDGRTFATGLRNCSAMAVQPGTGALWCATNERDGLGDNLPPDYVTRVAAGAFYGWPWYYIGGHQDPRHAGERADLKEKVAVPDVLLQPHSAPLGMTFYDAAQFPPAYRGSAFVALHGSWNRAKRTGYKVVRIVMKDGKPSGEYEDFLTGFVISDDSVWARPVGVAVARDGALLVGEDGNGTIWRVRYAGAAN